MQLPNPVSLPLIGLAFLSRLVCSWDISLEVTTQISGAHGGQPFQQQPILSVNNLRGELQSSFEGKVAVQLFQNTTGHAVLSKDNEPGDSISQYVINGIAEFSGLSIDAAGDRYQLEFTLHDEHGLIMGTVISDLFVVEIGSPYAIDIVSHPESAYGGSVFGNQPVLAIKDRGGNIVTNTNDGTVTVSSDSATLRCAEECVFAVPVVDGIASFNGLYINEAGTDYSLQFTSDLSLEGSAEVVSNIFSVGIGPAASIVLVHDTSEGIVYGGKAFTPQPRVEVHDAGGNIVTIDSRSAIEVSFYSNPSDGVLHPVHRTTEYLQQGIAQFRSLSIDKAGEDYRLSYAFLKYEHNELVRTSIAILGEPFNVKIGHPSRLSILQNASVGWAGNQLFKVQPRVALVDAGGNVVVDDSSTVITAEMTPSISYSSYIIVDTTHDPTPSIESISFASNIILDDRVLYGPGDIIGIIVVFTEEITLYSHSEGNATRPRLALNVKSYGIAGQVYAELSSISQEGVLSKILRFEYNVSMGDSQLQLDYLSIDAIQTSDYLVEDAFGRNVDLALPTLGSGASLSGSKPISISSSKPSITSIRIDLPAGEFEVGAGHVLDLILSFDREVVVNGYPELPLNVESTIAVIDTIAASTIHTGSYFTVTYKGEESEPIPWDASALEIKRKVEAISAVLGDICISRDNSPNALSWGGFRWAIRMSSIDDDIFELGVDGSGMHFSQDGSVQVKLHTTGEALDGWSPNDGDIGMCTVRTSTYLKGSGTQSLYFRFQVMHGDNVKHLDVKDGAGLLLSGLDCLSLLVNGPNQSPLNADLGFQGINSSPDHDITVITERPKVTSVVTQTTTTPDGLYTVGDALYFEVSFDKPVHVEIGLEMELNSGENAVARYFSGSGTDILLLEYLVQVGDETDQLDFTDSLSLVAKNTEGKRSLEVGYVRRQSTLPSTDADLSLSLIDRLPSRFSIKIDGSTPTLLDVSIHEMDQGQELARGDEFKIVVRFSARVEIDNSDPPLLGLLIGEKEKWAIYSFGSGSSTLTFIYIVQVGDTSAPLELKYTRICRRDNCSNLEGLVLRQSSVSTLDADLEQGFSNKGITIASTPEFGVTIDTSASGPTTVKSVQIALGAGVYSAGTAVDIKVHFSDAVFLSEEPILWLNTDSNAVYSSGNATTALSFSFTTTLLDNVPQLDLALFSTNNSAIECYQDCTMVNGNGVEVDTSFDLIDPLPYAIVLDPSPPTIISVQSNKGISPYCHSQCSYTVGEEIFLAVSFDRPVITIGTEISLSLDVGDESEGGKAWFVPRLSSESELVFLYTVQHGHSSNGASLSYLCEPSRCSIELGAGAAIKCASDQPIVDADVNLPPPESFGVSTDESSPIIIDTSGQPRVMTISTTSADRRYSPGDMIEIIVEFSRTVVVIGEPFLTLNVGDNDSNIATYHGGSGSSTLFFHYEVGLTDRTFDLDYIDAHSLFFGLDGVHAGSIKQASTHPTIDAIVDLPFPGDPGSLSYSADIIIDNRQPYISSIKATAQDGSLICNTGKEVLVEVQFSRPVTVHGVPFLKLETGMVDRFAHYDTQIDEHTIQFKYIIQLGDSTARLDYWSDGALLPSSSTSFDLNGGWIRSTSANPTLDADLHLNPVDGHLGGNKRWAVSEGIVRFNDLKMSRRGKDYRIRYSSFVVEGVIEAEQEIQVAISIEYEVQGDLNNRDPGDQFGRAIAIQKDMIAVGAPRKRNPTHEIQVLTVFSESSIVEHEVQMITTSLNKREATTSIHEFSTCGDADETIGGTYKLSFKNNDNYAYASHVISLDSDATAENLKTTLESELAMWGLISTSRSDNADCESPNAWTWSLTFVGSSRSNGFIETNGEDLLGNGAYITPASITREVDVLGGTFTITNPSKNIESRPIPFDASASFVKEAIEEDLSISVKSVQAENTDTLDKMPELGRRWIVFFRHHMSEYGLDVNIPPLEASAEGLDGNGALVWTHTYFEGRGPLSGSFAVSLRDSEFSRFISHDASAEELQDALQSLDSINEVRVSGRSDFIDKAGKSGTAWTITFLSVNKLTDYGWLFDPNAASSSGNLPTLQVDSHLIGWNASYKVHSVTGAGQEDNQAQWMQQRMGDDGTNSGSVDVFHRVGETWRKEATIVASDHDSNDWFGHSLSLSQGLLLVGAPFKQVTGLPEEQTLKCTGPASNGSFIVGFRGFVSSPISHDATLDEMKSAIIGSYGDTSNLHPLPRLTLINNSDWDGSSRGFCSDGDTTVSITFLTPDGGGVSTAEHRSGDIEGLSIVSHNLTGATVFIFESRAGTKSPMGKNLNLDHATGKQSGSAFLYKRTITCITCHPSWTEVKHFSPLDALDDTTDAALFGWSSKYVPATDTSNALVIIGSPGYDEDSGKVYVFQQVEDDWLIMDTLTDENWNHDGIKGGRFGNSVDADHSTILIGSPGHSNRKGIVYVFRRSHDQQHFLASQTIYGPIDLTTNDQFGHSLSLSGNKAAICAPYKTVPAIHIRSSPKIAQNVGTCYTLSRQDETGNFQLEQPLTPSNVLSGDRFGWDVSLDGNALLVGQLEEFSEKLTPPRPIQMINTYCKVPPCSNSALSLFRLSWIKDDSVAWTPYLAADSTANRVRDAIEGALASGNVSVSRSVLSDDQGGYSWTVTFDSYAAFKSENKIPVLDCEMSPKSSLGCNVTVTNDIPQTIRSKAHLFAFDTTNSIWTEQAFLFPSTPQKQDLMGSSVALRDGFAVVGAPNRDLANVNSGAAFVFDTSFLNLDFGSDSFVVTEGETLDIEISRDLSTNQLLSLHTLDRNADGDLQQYINELYSFRDLEIYPYDKTSVDILRGSTALGRSQYYGSEERRSLFVNGQYDFRGVSDYELLRHEHEFKPREQSIIASLKTNDDTILERPHEHITIHINLRGMFASQLGTLYISVKVTEDQDGKSASNKLHYHKMDDAINYEELSRLGSAIDFDEISGMMVVSSEQASGFDADGNRHVNVGSAHIFKKESNGWFHIQTLSPPNSDVTPNMRFGHCIKIDTPYGRDDTTILISAPGAAASYVFSFQSNDNFWKEQAKLSVSEVSLPEEKFGEAVALYGDMAFVGAPGVETVYAYRRSYVVEQGFVNWDLYSTLRSSDYDFDIYGHNSTVQHLHRQSFGIALAANRRTVLIGAPFADYGNRGHPETRENLNTDGIHNKGIGKGKVYAFWSQPAIQVVKLVSDEVITSGSFRLKLSNHKGIDAEFSELIRHDASSDACKRALEAMSYIGEVIVDKQKLFHDNLFEVSWSITFISSFEDAHPLLVPYWNNNGCNDCDEFGVSVLSSFHPFLTVTQTHTHQPFAQEAELQPRDVTSTDQFGSSLDIDGPQAIIGSKFSAAKTRSTFDFETGTLIGWSSRGNAFQFQPTFGDNSRHRGCYRDAATYSTGEPQSSSLIGRYYVGTFEKHPGDEKGSYEKPSSLYPIGSIQGDVPTGDLTSDPFVILGDNISFLLGGGCNHLTVYVELLVDGIPALRATGKCHERMERVYFDVQDFISRTGQLRIVDRGSGKWDHINVDSIQFSWQLGSSKTCLVNNFGECSNGGGALPKSNPADYQHYTGKEESAQAGAAYTYYRECPALPSPGLPSNTGCRWIEQERLTASDKRPGSHFGTSVSIDNTRGVAIIGSPNSPALGIHQEPIYVHPHSNVTTFGFPIPENLGRHKIQSGLTYSTTGGSISVMDYLARVNNVPIRELSKYTEEAGMAYVFLRQPAKVEPNGDLIRDSYWRTTEHARIAPPDVSCRDHFGYSLSLRGSTAVMGAIGHDGYAKDGGGAYAYDMEWIWVKFAQVEFVAVEGADRQIKIFLQRDLAWSNSTYSIGYSTSDLSAIGVDANKYDECMRLHASQRDGCGDFEQAAGEVFFDDGDEFAHFTVRIMDDLCIERDMEFVQLNLHIIGGTPIHGEDYRAMLRIDDDEGYYVKDLTMECEGRIS